MTSRFKAKQRKFLDEYGEKISRCSIFCHKCMV